MYALSQCPVFWHWIWQIEKLVWKEFAEDQRSINSSHCQVHVYRHECDSVRRLSKFGPLLIKSVNSSPTMPRCCFKAWIWGFCLTPYLYTNSGSSFIWHKLNKSCVQVSLYVGIWGLVWICIIHMILTKTLDDAGKRMWVMFQNVFMC